MAVKLPNEKANMRQYVKRLLPLKKFCPCGNEGILLPNGKYLRREGAPICERCRKVQSEMYHGWFKDSEIMKRRESARASSVLTSDGVMV